MAARLQAVMANPMAIGSDIQPIDEVSVFLELDGNGPAYAQLTRALKASILSGRLQANTRLPSTRALALEVAMSRITVLTAYEQLRAEGFVYSRVGAGSYVNRLQTSPPLHLLQSEPIAAPSRYAKRARAQRDPLIARRHRGLRLDLQYGEPMTQPALSTSWARELAHAAAYTPLQRGDPQGLLALREQICRHLALHRGVEAHPSQVLITNGSQQAYALTARVLLNEGDTTVLEEPHYFGMWQSFAAHGASLLPVRTDREGLVCSELPLQTPRLICVTPSHQFPSGPVMSLSRRVELLRYAEARRSWILEDDYDSEFCFESQPLAALRSLDDGDRVIYVGTFSKTLFGSLRMGYMVLPAALRQDFINAKYLADVCNSVIEQAALAHFMESGGFERHLRHMAKTLKERREVLLDGLRCHAGARIQIADSHAGMHVVIWLREYSHAQLEALIDYAHERGLGLYPIGPHYHARPTAPGLVLGYGGLSSMELQEAAQLFGACLDAIDAQMIRSPVESLSLRRHSG